jgi:hypothetical protein
MFAPKTTIQSRGTNQWNNQVSTADTIQQMQMVANAAIGTPQVIATCQKAIADLDNQWFGEKDYADAVWYWVKNNIRFVTDENTMQQMGIPIDNPTKDLLISPQSLLSMPSPQGDCDDFSMLCKAMLSCLGFRNSFITIKADRDYPNMWSHVYNKVYFSNNSTMAMDCSHGHWPGWEYKNYWEKREW